MRQRSALLIVFAALSLSAFAALEPKTDYERLQRWQFSAPIPLPAAGVTIARDTATWTLASGTVRLMEPLADGTVTGVVFEGQGRFTMTIPDRYELAQLRRFAEKEELTSIEQPAGDFVVKLVKHSGGKASGFAKALSPTLVKVDQHRPRPVELGRALRSVPLHPVTLKNPALELSQLFAMRLRDAGEILIPCCGQF